jgi:hypothetical protein
MYPSDSLMYVIRAEPVSLGCSVQGAATHTQEYGGVPLAALESSGMPGQSGK